MTPELNGLLKKIQELNRMADEPGAISLEQLEEEVKRIAVAVKEGLANMGKELPPELVGGASGLLVDIFKVQLGTLIQKSGLALQQSDKMQKLADELELIKRGFIRS
ncbi:MAG: hypothetical protein JXB05_03215 [Myxococcaceae bacterium]|nr:hypothetical protein [Myxococcaceae bacterium]